MDKEAPAYRKLRGMRATGIMHRCRLWLGDDHLLAVSSSFGFERYRRFYFTDIRALVLRRTAVRLLWNLFFGAAAGLLLGGAALCAIPAQKGGGEAYVFWVWCVFLGGAGLVFLAGLVWNTALGPTCELHVQTIAGLEPADAPGRWEAALRLTRETGPLIAAAQGEPSHPAPPPPAPPLA